MKSSSNFALSAYSPLCKPHTEDSTLISQESITRSSNRIAPDINISVGNSGTAAAEAKVSNSQEIDRGKTAVARNFEKVFW